MKDQKEAWLKETGYTQEPFGDFRFIIRIDDYGAMNRFNSYDVIKMPLEIMQEIHADFIERAERKEIF